MSDIIHARETKKGIRYRVWSTIVDAYLTKELTEKQLHAYTLERALSNARRDHEHNWPGRLERAQRRGTSSFNEPAHDLSSPWETERS